MQYVFEQIMIDVDKRELWVDQRWVPVRPQVFDLLVVLAQSRGQALSKEDLVHKLWPNQAVRDGVLSACIREARKAVGDSGRAQRLIKTLHGYGFRLLAEVRTEWSPHPDHASSQSPVAQPTSDRPEQAGARSSQARIDERRRVTFLCCCTCTPQANSQNNIQALHKRDKDFVTCLHQVALRYGGYVLEADGSEVSMVFGLTHGLEDATIRAVLAARTLCDRSNLSLCAGVDTGRVVAGFSKHSRRWHITQVDKVEQRAQDLLTQRDAPAIWLSDRAWQQVRDQVEAQQHSFAGRSIYRVCSIKPHLQRPALRREHLRTRFVGRTRELTALLGLIDQVRAGQGQLVGLVGEAGLGKTRLCQEFLHHLEPESPPSMVAFCRSYGRDEPFGLVIDLVRRLCELDVEDSVNSAVAKIHTACQRCGIEERGERAILHLLRMEPATDNLWDAKSYFQDVSLALKQLIAGSLSRTRIVVIEDLHFIDSSSEASLQALAAMVASLKMLLLVTYRTGYQPPFMGLSYASQIALQPLGDTPSTDLVEHILGPNHKEPSQQRAIVARAQGNPLFLQELALQQNQAEASSTGLSSDSVPTTIQAVIRSRIDCLPHSTKRLLQLAAVIGNEFDLALLQSLVENQQTDLLVDLNRLQEDEFLHQTGWQPPRYAFRHRLTQSATYQSLLTRDRRRWHREVVTHLKQLDPLLVEKHPERLAFHYQQCEDWQKATRLWTQSAKLALERFAGPEALTHLQHALECLQAQGPIPGTDETELKIQTLRLTALQLSQGFAACEVEQAQQRVSELTDRLGGNHHQPPEIMMRVTRGEFQTAEKMARTLLQKAKKENNSDLLITALDLLGVTLSHMGRFVESNQILKRSIEVDKKSHHNPKVLHEPCVNCYCLLALNYGGMGFGDQSRTWANKATQLAQELQHLSSLVMANYLGSFALAELGLFDLAAPQSQQAIELAEQNQIIFWLSGARLIHGWARFHLGEEQAGLAQVEQAFGEWSDTNARIALPVFHAVLAELTLKTGQVERATEHIRLGLLANDQDSQRLREPELLRLQAQALLAKGAMVEEVDRKLVQAQASAGELQAKLFELRAVADRVRLWRGTAREQEMRQNLRHLLDWFTEGLDLPDILHTKQLLQQVSE